MPLLRTERALPKRELLHRRRRRGLVITISVILLLLLLVACLAVAAWLYRKHILLEPGEHTSRQAILDIISEESPVYFSDGRTRLGVFFAREHREYVPYDQIPQQCVDAIVAAEDKRFFQHHGVDPQGITRAMIQNIKAGRLVAGGSTLTQQTAKNLYYRPDRSVRSKGVELLNALRLEAHFSKEEILEFYFNQFHVSGNGRGLGIAARYFFDKDVERLNLHECAFLAGMVKAPAHYTPWTGRSEEDRQSAREMARQRTAYVLGRMAETGAIDQDRFLELAERPVPFKRGHFRYERSILLDEVERRLSQAPFPEVFARAGIDNPSTAGLQIVTTLDRDAQTAATYGLWHHLSWLGTYMDGAGLDAFLLPAEEAPRAILAERPLPREFLAAKVAEVRIDSPALQLELGAAPVARGSKEVATLRCSVDKEALQRVADILLRSKRANHWVNASGEQRKALVAGLKPGAVVWASVREEREGELFCDLEARPELQGALVVLERGQVRAMVGGNDNKNFNRAVQAQRQYGSTWKPLVYHAAMQLGWETTDILDNRRNVFPFEGTWYYPRPDHDPEPAVSLAWAGTRSENLASIWLLFHLADRLNPEQIRRLAELTDLAPRDGEERKDYIVRIRDEYGVIALQSRLEESLFEGVRRSVQADLAFTGHPEDAFELRSLHHGRGFSRERQRVLARSGGAERRARLQALDRSFLYLEERSRSCRAQMENLGSPLELAIGAVSGEPPSGDLSQLFLRRTDGELVCSAEDQEDLQPLAELISDAEGLELLLESGRSLDAEDLLVEGILHLSTLDALRAALDRQLELKRGTDPWAPELIYQHTDFRRLLGMRYVAMLARSMGVQTEIPPVLSMPLGAAEISLIEVAGLYQGFLEGATYRFPGQVFVDGAVPGLRDAQQLPADASSTAIIAQIRDRNGAVIYRNQVRTVPVVDQGPGRLTADILGNVVNWGTGRRARGAVQVRGQTWPLFGKTGTTNEYRNAAFCGYAPVARDGRLDPADALTVAAYVGFDDNRPMRRGSLRVSGSSGALPAWIETIRGLGDAELLTTDDELPAALRLTEPSGTTRLAVAEGSGLPLDRVPEEGERSILAFSDSGGQAGGGKRQRRYALLNLPEDLLPPPADSAPSAEREEGVAEPDEGAAASREGAGEEEGAQKEEGSADPASEENPASIWDDIEQGGL